MEGHSRRQGKKEKTPNFQFFCTGRQNACMCYKKAFICIEYSTLHWIWQHYNKWNFVPVHLKSTYFLLLLNCWQRKSPFTAHWQLGGLVPDWNTSLHLANQVLLRVSPNWTSSITLIKNLSYWPFQYYRQTLIQLKLLRKEGMSANTTCI